MPTRVDRRVLSRLAVDINGSWAWGMVWGFSDGLAVAMSSVLTVIFLGDGVLRSAWTRGN